MFNDPWSDLWCSLCSSPKQLLVSCPSLGFIVSWDVDIETAWWMAWFQIYPKYLKLSMFVQCTCIIYIHIHIYIYIYILTNKSSKLWDWVYMQMHASIVIIRFHTHKYIIHIDIITFTFSHNFHVGWKLETGSPAATHASILRMMKVTIIIYLGVQFKLWYIIIMIVKWLYNDTLRGYIQTNGG